MKMKKLLSYLLIGMMVFTVAAPTSSAASPFPDMPNNWSTKALQNAVNNGLISGVPQDGKLYIKPNNTLKRAEMAVIINKAFGSWIQADITGVRDIDISDWFYDHMATAVQMESFAWAPAMRPTANITREEAFTVIAKVFQLPDASGYSALSAFTDAGSVSDYAKGRIAALLEKGYISGSGNKLNPKNNITRAEFAAVMDNIVKQYINTPGTVTTVDSGNVVINCSDVVLQDVSVNGDLIIADGVDEGSVMIDNVKVSGRLVVRGGGANSIEITGRSAFKEVIVNNLNYPVRIYTDSNTQISFLSAAGQVILDGKFSEVDVTGESAEVEIYGAVDHLNVQAPSYVYVGIGASLKTADIQQSAAGAILEGEGRVERVNLKAHDTQVNTNNTRITVAAGVKNASSGNTWLDAGTTFISDPQASNQTPPKAGESSIDKVQLNATSVTFVYGNTGSSSRKKLTAVISPSNVPNKRVIWDISGTYASRYELYDAATSGNLVEEGIETDLLTVYVAPAVSTLSLNHTATVSVTTVDGNKSDSCKIIVEQAGASETPKASITNVAKTAAIQKSVAFTLTNAPSLQGTWKVYTGASGTTLASGISCSNSGSTLTLSHGTDIPAGTYYVAVTEEDKTESGRLALTVSPYGTTYTITGTITGEGAGGLPAGIQLKNSTGQNVGDAVTAASDGTYTISGVTTGGYTIAVTCDGYAAGVIDYFSLNDNRSGMNLELLKARYTIEGTITGEDGAGIAAALQLKDGSGNNVGNVVIADSDGKYKIAGVLPGSYTIAVSMAGYHPITIPNVVVSNVNIVLGTNALIKIAVPQTFAISGIVKNTSGTAISGAKVSLWLSGINKVEVTTDSSGAYAISNVSPDSYTIEINAVGYDIVSDQITVADNITGKDFTLTPVAAP